MKNKISTIKILYSIYATMGEIVVLVQNLIYNLYYVNT